MLLKFWTWLQRYNKSTHILALACIAIPATFYGDPDFHKLVMAIYHWLPGWLETLIGAALYIYALYKTGALKANDEPTNAQKQAGIQIKGQVS